VARVKAVLRRVSGQVLPPEVFKVGGIEVDVGQYVARCHGEEVSVTASEVRLLASLAKEPGMVKSRAELLAATGDAERFADERTVDAHVKNIRRKLNRCGEQLETVRGVGYRLRG
jgi:DNA-binding response OmpR family regulator